MSFCVQLAQLPHDFKPLREADAALVMYRSHVSARHALQSALQLKSPGAILTALAEAEDLKLEISEMSIAKSFLKNAGLSQSSTTQQLMPMNLGDDEAREKRENMLNNARGARYELKNFSGLRSPDDYAKGVMFNRRTLMDGMLLFQKDVINKSLCELDKDLNKTAVNMHKNLLGYMGEKRMSYPTTLAQDILQTGFNNPAMRDEIYCQLIKQLSSNPKPDSVGKGWQLMCMCCSTFAPSPEFQDFLMHYVVTKMDTSKGAIVDYAKYCLRSLEGLIASGLGKGQEVPSEDEITAYGLRPPSLVTIELLDGQIIVEDLPVTPDLNVGAILEMIYEWKTLTDPRMSSLGLFVHDCGEIKVPGADVRQGLGARASSVRAFNSDLEWTPRPIRNDEFIGDIKIQKARQNRNFKFILKKKIFLPAHCVRGFHDLIDPYYERLLFIQAEDDYNISGTLIPESEEQATYLAACSLILAFGEETPNTIEGLIANNVNEFVPLAYRERNSLGDWGRKILKFRNGPLVDMSDEDIQWEYIKIAQDNPFYGVHWFNVHKLSDNVVFMQSFPYDLILGFNFRGLHIFDTARTLLHMVSYSELARWGGSSSQFSVIVPNPIGSAADKVEIVLSTSQSADIIAIILDYIDSILRRDSMESK